MCVLMIIALVFNPIKIFCLLNHIIRIILSFLNHLRKVDVPYHLRYLPCFQSTLEDQFLQCVLIIISSVLNYSILMISFLS